MKIANIFKKKTSKKLENKAEVLNNSQLEKVIGGADTTETVETTTAEKTRLYGPGQAHWGNAK